MGEYEFASETDRVQLKILLKVRPGMAPGPRLGLVQQLGAGWQVPHYAVSLG
jgi:hypothetical protein